MIHRSRRSDQTRAANEVEVNRYGGRLEAIFHRWLGSGGSVIDLADQLERAAADAFAPAFLRGKRQALPNASLDDGDRQLVAQQIASNAYYVRYSLEVAIQTRRQLAGITGEDESKVLDDAFSSRIRLQYGGRLWQVMEAGHQAGIRRLAQLLRLRLRQPALVQAAASVDDFGEEDDGELDEISDIELAASLGISLAALLALIGQVGGRQDLSIKVGTEYRTEEDDQVCEPCEGDAGDYWLPDEPPLPGEDCRGAQNCRCYLNTISEVA